MSFIEEPVCLRQLALDVIEDRCWVFFADPVLDRLDADAEFLAQESDNLRLRDDDLIRPSLERCAAVPHRGLRHPPA